MTIPKKGRRTIAVDEVEFHYKVAYERSERMVIQLATGRGASLFIFPHAIMKPIHVADAIRFALSKGWSPGENSNDYWMAFDVDANGGSLLESIPNDDFRVVTYPTGGKLSAETDPSKYSDQRRWHERPIRPEN